MRLDIPLMNRSGFEFPFDDHISQAKARLYVTVTEFHPLCNIGRFLRCRIDAFSNQVIPEQRSIRFHSLVHINDVRQHLIININQFQGLPGNPVIDRGHCGHRMSLKEGFFPSHDIPGHVPVIDDHLSGGLNRADRLIGKIISGHDRLDTRQGQRL